MFLTCTAPAAAQPGAPEGASSCGSLNCSYWWWQNHSCNTWQIKEKRKKKERQEDWAATLTSCLLRSPCWFFTLVAWREIRDLQQNREEIATLRKGINHNIFHFVALWMLRLEDESGFVVVRDKTQGLQTRGHTQLTAIWTALKNNKQNKELHFIRWGLLELEYKKTDLTNQTQDELLEKRNFQLLHSLYLD